ncbi:LysR family transcriptional regulator [Amycolatopsis nigrescens]|uniref:LysR family transcriptional regulator n=1 Tax=Amycolatopsis nigrescens TaxID=381445 RepID=UPI000368D8A6|nr:LysR family transcriptional regulator [Amycolatopsis nigrescens]
MDLTVAHLQALLAVEEHGSFTRAAGALGLTQSAVSRTIAAVERRFGRKLVHRGPGGASLTALGRQVAEHGHAVVGRLRAIDALAQRRDEPRLRVGAVASALVRLVPAALDRLRADWPELDVLTARGDDDELADWLAADTIDFAVTTVRIPGSRPAGVVTDEFLAVLPRRHRLGYADRVGLADLAGAGVADPGGTCGPLLAARFAEQGVSWRPDHTVRDVSTVLAMVAAGITAGVVPALAAPVPAVSKVVLRPLDPPVHRSLYLYRAPGNRYAKSMVGMLAGSGSLA